MTLRTAIKSRPKLAVAGAGGLVALAISFGVIQLQPVRAGAFAQRAFFSADDGATWFADDLKKNAPFAHEGKEADRAYVYECGGNRFVGYLERLTPAGMKVAEATKQGFPTKLPPIAGSHVLVEVKKPGDKKWVCSDDYAKSAKVFKIDSPDGGVPQPVSP